MDTTDHTAPIKPCKRCGIPYPRTSEFYAPAVSCKDGLRLVCRCCMTAKDSERYQRMRDEILKALKCDRQLNLEHYREIDRQRNKRPHRKALHAARTAKRRSILKQAEGKVTAADIELQYRSQKRLCWWCGKPLGSDYHIDHRIPLVQGGSNAPENLCLTCPTCNMSKGGKLPQEWNGRLL